ncbi:uncharacterized protein P174DRAFT_302021 [Aspergillus novofumigatus IBT 16806]|uniref:Uncharacterized protein n=1 Tax=Aspergillus novofumigatus (strain IBT 16806) TaxID=1392255 RepID=A0A2I1BW23_ASPN1|nr:uncharacterized protein P174DRAFT_302021 [Aspergillus novofumigatus IBT 16806]PKX89584.1 hypothetical protein P174DRAFT_302021 [Aspergillus novofumigatus IBT 16806]
MAPVAQSDIEMYNHTSDMASQASSLRRQFSEPLSAHSTSTQTSQSPSSLTHKSKCYLCGEYFNTSKSPNDDYFTLKEHIAAAHPHSAKRYSLSAAKEHTPNGQLHTDRQLTEDAGASGVDDVEAEDTGDAEETEVVRTYDAGPDGELDEAISGLSTPIRLDGFSRGQTSIIEHRVYKLWNINDVSKFSEDFEDRVEDIENTWDTVFRNPKRGTKRDASDSPERFNPYKKSKVAKGEFLEITPLENILSQLRDPEYRSVDELYAITENVHLTLKTWQDEYLAIDKLYRLATRQQSKPSADPRKLEDPTVFESQREAMLYGYKYDPKAPGGVQDPFDQGGFMPTAAQTAKIRAKGDPNPDGWPIIHKFGIPYVPMLPKPPAQSTVAKNTRRRKAAELEAASQEIETDDAFFGTPVPAEDQEDSMPPAKRRTRQRRTALEVEQTQDNTPIPSAPLLLLLQLLLPGAPVADEVEAVDEVPRALLLGPFRKLHSQRRTQLQLEDAAGRPKSWPQCRILYRCRPGLHPTPQGHCLNWRQSNRRVMGPKRLSLPQSLQREARKAMNPWTQLSWLDEKRSLMPRTPGARRPCSTIGPGSTGRAESVNPSDPSPRLRRIARQRPLGRPQRPRNP